MSSLSSGGMDAELQLNPDFGAVGGLVYSSISPHAADAQSYTRPYACYGGTSMASPYAAGMPLLLQKRGKMYIDERKSALPNNAAPVKKYMADSIETVALQSAGLLNAFNGTTAKAVVTPSFLSLNDSQYTRKDHYSVNIMNDNTVQNVGALTANPFDGVSDFVQAKTTVVAAGESHQVNVKVTPPASANPSLLPIYSGYIAITNNVDDSITHFHTWAWSAIGWTCQSTRIAEVIYTGTDAAVKDALNKLGVGHNRNQGIPVIRTSSNGTISGAYVSLAPRNTPVQVRGIDSPVVYYWASAIVADTAEAEKVVLLPPGEYKLRSKGLKHFKPSMAMSTARI
ncbi:hypothetical protein DFJ73DRAFT_931830 [Zopfochytrium polystomum]|nr:hypothetical protein DFJ73DRAFT_931830 [Zopfochytrium polystomum]